jgi:hypothetical protein
MNLRLGAILALTVLIYIVETSAYAARLAGVRTVLALPAFLTGGGTVLMVLLVDPLTAHVVDQALRGERPPSDVTAITVWQIGGRLTGTLLAQLLLTPVAALLAAAAGYLVR